MTREEALCYLYNPEDEDCYSAKTEPMSEEEMMDTLKGLIFGTFDRTTAKEREALDMAIKTLEQEPCEDCISRQAVLNAIMENSIWENEYNLTSSRIKKAVEDLPPVNPQPKTGHWISVNTGKQIHLKDGRAVESVKCSECDEWLIASDEYDCNGNYCPNCGAKMIEPQEESEVGGGMTKIYNKWKRVNLGNDMYSQSLNECPFCDLRLLETYNFENTYIYCPKCGKKVIYKEKRWVRDNKEGGK